MSKVTADMSMSLDGYIAGPNDSITNGLGDGGDRLHEWMYGLSSWRERHGLEGGSADQDAEILDESFRGIGAILMGRRMFDLAEEPWGDIPPFHMPVFVLTHRPRERLAKAGGTVFTFVTDGLESAFEQARAAAGSKDLAVGGGAQIIQECLHAGLLDEIQLHLVPVLLNGGRRLFDPTSTGPVELEPIRVIESPGVIHLRFRVIR